MTVSTLHEVLVEMFRSRPSLAARLLADPLEIKLPAWQDARLEPADLTVMTPTQYQADAVVTLSANQRPELAVVVEVQLRRERNKRYTWPVYVAVLRERLRCDTALLVICPEASVANWAGEPIDLGPGSMMSPLVIGPDQVPKVTDVEQAAESPELAVMSAMAHGGEAGSEDVLRAFVTGLRRLDERHQELYIDIVASALPAAARRSLEALMNLATWEPQSDWLRGYVSRAEAKAEAKGEADALLTVLAARGVDVPDESRARIVECTDVDLIKAWLRRAVTASSVRELFA